MGELFARTSSVCVKAVSLCVCVCVFSLTAHNSYLVRSAWQFRRVRTRRARRAEDTSAAQRTASVYAVAAHTAETSARGKAGTETNAHTHTHTTSLANDVCYIEIVYRRDRFASCASTTCNVLFSTQHACTARARANTVASTHDRIQVMHALRWLTVVVAAAAVCARCMFNSSPPRHSNHHYSASVCAYYSPVAVRSTADAANTKNRTAL